MPNPSVVVGMLTHTAPDQINRVVERVLTDQRVGVAVHHDPRGPSLSLPGDGRARLVTGAQAANWGSMGVAEAQIRCLAHALDTFPGMEWFLLVSGADYPARDIGLVCDELATTDADAFVRWFRVDPDPDGDVHPWQALTRRRYLHRRRLPWTHRSVPFPRRPPFRAGEHLFVGDLWVNVSRAAGEHIVRRYRARPDIVRYFRWCSVPDEALLPTLLLNGAELNVVPDHRRYIRWSEGARHPELLTAADVAAVSESSAFFARKFDPERSADAMAVLDDLAAVQRRGSA